jgi:hypothetical protein
MNRTCRVATSTMPQTLTTCHMMLVSMKSVEPKNTLLYSRRAACSIFPRRARDQEASARIGHKQEEIVPGCRASMPRFGEDESLGIDALQPGTISSHVPDPCRGQLITLRRTVAGRLEFIRGSLS